MESTNVEFDSPDHVAWVLKEFQVMQQKQLLCDVRLTAGDDGVSAHKLVLMAASPSMRLRLSTDSVIGMEYLHFDNIPLSLVESVVHFMYTGKLKVETSSIKPMLKFCEELELSSAITFLKDYIKNVLSDSDEIEIKPSIDEIEMHDENTETDKAESESASKRSNRRVKQKPRKRAARDSSRKDGTPEKLMKPSSTVLLQKVLKDETGNEKPKRGRPKKSDKTNKGAHAKSTSRKSKYVSKKIKKEKVDDTENEFEPIKVERNKSHRKEVNELKNVIQANNLLSDIKKEPESVKDDDGDNDDEQENFESDSTIEVKPAEIKEAKPLKRVYKKRKRQDHPCSLCDKTLSTSKRLAFHEYSQHGIEYDRTKYKMFHCPVEGCNHVSSSRNNMRTHTRSRHGDERPHICEFCGKSFKLQNVLATHLNLHTGAKVFECKQCGERFNQHAGLDVHIKRHHMGESTWGELCHLCSEKFLQKAELCWHLFRVHNQPLPERYKAYTCDQCNFVTKKRQNMERHKNAHSEFMLFHFYDRYTCDECNFVTKSCQDMERHRNAHNGIKAFMCSICSKGCATKSELKRHVMYHGEKNFKCTFENCTYACVDNLGLQKHIQLMHTHKHFKPYICPVCKYRTGVKGNLDKHIRQVHSLEVVSKHTVPLKMKYKNFEQGDVITKDGHLVASAQERKALLQQELAMGGMTPDKKATSDSEVRNSITPIINHETPSDHGASNVHLESKYAAQQQSNVYEGNQRNVQSSPVSESLPISSPEPVSSHARMYGNYGYTEMSPLTSHMPQALGAEDLRMGLASHLANSQLFQEGFQGYLADRSMEHGDISVDTPRTVTSI